MKNYGVSLITGFLLGIHLFSFAQQQPLPKTLLWKISGRGLSQPSYLFGTMHLTDKRLFYHGDSVFHAITATQGFAMEINPEEMAASMVSEMFNDLENKKKLESVLDEEDFNRYKKALAKKFKKDPEDITVDDIVQEKNKWVNEYLTKGEMPTMLDAYLYNMARKQGKWIGGIEDLGDQTDLEEDLVDVTDVEFLLSEYNSGKLAKKQLEQMIRVYSEGDLAGIEAISSGAQSANERDVMLVKRNVKMARRMDSLSAIRTMFFAVGAAHLPGDSGVIDLLKRRGFNVDPVFSKRKINAADFKYREVDIPWKTVTDPEDLYTVSMPGIPVDLKHNSLIDMKCYMDLFNLTAYITFAAPTPRDVSNPDSMFMGLAKNIFTSVKGLKQVVIDTAGLVGREFHGKMESGTARIRLLLNQNIVFVAMAMQMKEEKSYSPDVKKFLNSFVINRDAQKNRAAVFKFSDSTMGVSLETTARLEYNEKMSNTGGDEWKVTTFAGSDLNSGAYIILMSKQTMPGRYIVNDSLVMSQMYDYVVQQYGELNKKAITIHGFPALMFEGDNLGDEKLSMRMATVVRGNRNIIVMVFAQKSFFENPESRKTFESLRFLPYPSRSWKYYTDSTNTFTAWTPAPFKWDPYSNTGYRRGVVVAHDSIAALSFNVSIDTINTYYSVESDSFYWNLFKADLVKENDSLISYNESMNGKSVVREFVVRKNHSNMYQRVRALFYGNYLVIFHTTSHLKDLYDDNVVKFYHDFRVHTKEIPFSIGTSKSKQLLKDLLSKDSATKEQAASALSVVDFYKADSALLQSALLEDYGKDEEGYPNRYLNIAIADKLVEVNHPGTIDFVKRTYPGLEMDSMNYRGLLLYVLAKLKTKESIAALGELMVAKKPASELNYPTYSVLLDSLDLALTFIEKTKALRSDSIHGTLQAIFYSKLLDSGKVTRQSFDEAESDFIKVANSDLNAPDSIRDILGNSWDLISTMGRYSSPRAMAVLNRYVHDSRKNIRMHAVLQLLNRKQKVDPATVTSFAADRETRAYFYNKLKEINKGSFFPDHYKNQKSISESVLYNLDEDLAIQSSSYVGSRTATVKGKQLRFHLWKITIESEEKPETYLAVIGGFSLDSKDVLISEAYSGYYSSKSLGEYTVDELFKEFVEYRDSEEN